MSLAGSGVKARVDGRDVLVGTTDLLREAGVAVPEAATADMARLEAEGKTSILVAVGREEAGILAVADTVRFGARDAIARLHGMGLSVALLTGDGARVAGAVADKIGIREVEAGVKPEGKAAAVKGWQEDGKVRVAMVGDGVNDAPGLARADVGIAIGAGTDVAIQSAGVVLASSDPRAVLGVRVLSQAAYRKMVQNLAWAVGYNAIAIPLAAGVLAPVGVTLPPAAGAALMSISTIVVALNAQLLRRTHLRPA